VLLAVLLVGKMLPTLASSRSVVSLDGNGIGSVRFGRSKGRVVASLTVLFGSPAWRGVNTGCGPLWTEVVWNGIAAEFRRNSFTGYRFASAAHIKGLFGAPRVAANPGFPALATAKGITIGSTLGHLRSLYTLHLEGAGRWRSGSLVFVSNARRDPAPLTSRIIEIKTMSTCGDF
jgi:hypothetical protein